MKKKSIRVKIKKITRGGLPSALRERDRRPRGENEGRRSIKTPTPSRSRHTRVTPRVTETLIKVINK
jgi:hypothetical protein